MTTWFAKGSNVGLDLEATPTSAENTLGFMCEGNEGTEWVYVKASGAIQAYDAVGIAEDFTAYALTSSLAARSDRIGFAQVAFAAADYGFVALRGSDLKVKCKASALSDAQLWTTASAGKLDDGTAASALKVDGIVLQTSAGTAANGSAGIFCKAAFPTLRES